MISCKFAVTCAAPLCPLTQNMKNITWLSSDPVCHRKFLDSSILVRNQKMLAKHKVSGYFTLEMLTIPIHSPRNGIHPDISGGSNSKRIYRQRERAWISRYKVDKGVKFADLEPQKTLDVYFYPKGRKSAKIEVKEE